VCFALSGFVTGTILQEFWRGALVRRGATGTDVFTALVGLFARSRRRYGGYVVHLGIVVLFLGFAGGGFEREEEALLTPGQQIVVEPYTVQFTGLAVTDDGRKQMITAQLDVARDGAAVGGMYPARWFFRNREDEPTTEVAIRRSFADDLYIVLAGFEIDKQSAKLTVKVNPLINWIWFGIGIMVLGTGIALLPERAFAFATARIPAGAATTSMVLLLVCAGWGGAVRAQHLTSPETVPVTPRTPQEKALQEQIVCMCGTCGRQRLNECTCSDADAMRTELAGLIAKGMTNDQVIDYFVTKWGSQEVLASPIDKGFNRLAWLLPYGVGAIGIVTIGAVALRWSRRRVAPEPVLTTAPASLHARLDDELRDLD
jgi:cytochrome c-type biogenesis protein CcmF